MLLFAHSRQSDIDRLEPTAAHAHIYAMKRRTFIAGSTALAALGLASAGHAQGAEELARIDTYLNAMREAGGRFVQFNSDGSRSEGELWIRKPGLMRFEYDAPHSHVVISDGVWVAVVDRRSNDDANRVPLSRTPLNLILRDNIDLLRTGAVQRIRKSGAETRLIMIDPDEPDSGTLEMVFTENPLSLSRWITTNPQGQRTEIQLTDLQEGVSIPRGMFSIEAALTNRG